VTGQPADKRKRIDTMTGEPPQSSTVVTVSSRRKDGDSSSPSRTVPITSPTGIIQVVPYLLGFHPGRDVVIIGTRPPRHTVKITLRYSLDPAAVTDQVGHALAVLSTQHYDTAVAVGYGPEKLVTPFMDWLRPEAEAQGIRFTELLRVDTGQKRYWSYRCENPDCCAPEGTSYELTTNSTVTDMLASGMSEVLASREVLAATIGPCTGDEATSMERATRKAERRAARILRQTPQPGKPVGKHGLALAGIRAVQQAIRKYHRGDTLTHNEAAWLLVVLRDQWVRDDAWSRMDASDHQAHLRLWTDLTHLALPGYVVTPASLLAFVAWQHGNGAFANIALDRAMTENPDYSMARILRDALAVGMEPEHAQPPMTPGEVADWYAEWYGRDR
jgi:hypothetical protein